MKSNLLILAIAVSLSTAAAESYAGAASTGSQKENEATKTSILPPIVVTAERLSALDYDSRLDLGSPGDQKSVDKVVRLQAHSKYAKVDYGTSVKFVASAAGGIPKSFVWRFDGWPTDVIELDMVAPPGLIDHKVLVYIRKDPTHRGP